MTSVRAAKAKGAAMEYSIHDSLKPKFPNLLLTKQLGFVAQNDLRDDVAKIVIECKRHAGFSWNELLYYFEKLIEKSNGYTPYLIFRANRQPCLVMHFDDNSDNFEICVHEFQTYFGVPFLDRQNKKKGTE